MKSAIDYQRLTKMIKAKKVEKSVGERNII